MNAPRSDETYAAKPATPRSGADAAQTAAPSLVPQPGAHAHKFAAAAAASRDCAPDASHWDKVYAAAGMQP